ncbi:YeeE/YedE family protein [Enterovibrio coralii]|uniref:Transporter n=1 Tax=Enterovibrio coralii TaxID=294935 RepID=A0A135IB15_9GAMM|nr:YeeE/YedE family protein [Enterovibrio coralii]KXF82588.1 transporter [Enterovibrio coralii]
MLFRFIALLSGLLFGLGMMVSGMVDPVKVIGFLDVFGQWDPSLAFVMGGALMVFIPGYFLVIKKQNVPKLAAAFTLSSHTKPDTKLLSGSALFGIGWGLAGICPGPAITLAGTQSPTIGLFIISMLAGIFIVQVGAKKSSKMIESATH